MINELKFLCKYSILAIGLGQSTLLYDVNKNVVKNAIDIVCIAGLLWCAQLLAKKKWQVSLALKLI